MKHMTKQQLIKELQKHNNKQATVLITIGNENDDTLSTSEFEIHHADELEYIELFVHEDKCARQI